jgi:hypothetical protein
MILSIKGNLSGTFRGICIVLIVIFMIILVGYNAEISKETEGFFDIIDLLDIGFITILLNVRTLSVVEVFCHLDYCSKFFENCSKFFEKSSMTYYLKLLNFGII